MSDNINLSLREKNNSAESIFYPPACAFSRGQADIDVRLRAEYPIIEGYKLVTVKFTLSLASNSGRKAGFNTVTLIYEKLG